MFHQCPSLANKTLVTPASARAGASLKAPQNTIIAIFGTRIGTPAEEHVSGTVEEIKRQVAAGKVAKIYFSDGPIAPGAIEATQYASVKKFREECQSMGLYATFNSTEELRTEFGHHLDLEMNHARYRWLPVSGNLSGVAEVELSEDARR